MCTGAVKSRVAESRLLWSLDGFKSDGFLVSLITRNIYIFIDSFIIVIELCSFSK